MNRRGQKRAPVIMTMTKSQRSPSKVTEGIIADVTGIEAGSLGLLQEDILARLLHPMINEALVILEEIKRKEPVISM